MRCEGAEWKQIFQIIDAAYADYLTGMAALRKRVVDDVSRKLNDDGAVPDHPRRGARSRLAPARRRRQEVRQPVQRLLTAAPAGQETSRA